MPNFDYKCVECEHVFEVSYRLECQPDVVICPSCSSRDTKKLFNSCSFSVKGSDFSSGSLKRESEMMNELKEDYGVHSLNSKHSLDKVYADVKASGSMVKEKMQAERERNKKKTEEKQKKWMEGALKRTPERAKVRREMKMKDNSKKSKVKI